MKYNKPDASRIAGRIEYYSKLVFIIVIIFCLIEGIISLIVAIINKQNLLGVFWKMFKMAFWPGAVNPDKPSLLSIFQSFMGYGFMAILYGIFVWGLQDIYEYLNKYPEKVDIRVFLGAFWLVIKKTTKKIGGEIMKKMVKVFSLVAGLAVLVLIIVWIATQKSVQKPVEITWGGPKNIAMLPIIAQEKGFFEQEGLKAKRQDIQTGKMTMDALIRGSVDFGVLVETNIAFIAFQPGSDLRVVAIIEEKFDDAILARKDKGIISPKDLEGKRLGITYATTSHAFAVQFLKSREINLDKITFVNMPPPSIQAGIISGTLDAGCMWQPFRFNVKKELGDKVVEFNDTTVYKAFSIIVVRKDFADKHPEVIKKYLQALIKAEEYLNNNLNESQQIISQQINIPLDVLKSVWNEYKLHVHLSKELLTTIQNEGKWIKETLPEYKDKNFPDYTLYINPEFLKEIDSQRVQGL